jgi:hypothetical protein
MFARRRINTFSAPVLLLVALLILPGCATHVGRHAASGPEYWQTVARADLDAIRELILDAHPGALDDANPDFRVWTEAGHREAHALVPRIFHYDSMLAVVRYYVSGFHDGHLIYSDNIRSDAARMHHTGWRVDDTRHGYEVVAVAPQWSVPLPPLGSRLVQCDGRPIESIVRERVAPFIDRRDLAGLRSVLALGLSHLMLKDSELRRCEFVTLEDKTLVLEVAYRPLDWNTYGNWFVAPLAKPRPDRRNGYDLVDGVLWIRAPSFMLSPEEVVALEAMLDSLQSLEGVRTIVFDARQNAGGDSSVGDRIFSAATGGLSYDTTGIERLPVIYAQWRVSDVAIDSGRKFVERRRAQYGASSDQLRYAESRLQAMLKARETGAPWVEQIAGPRMDREEIRRRHGHLENFTGPVVLLTDRGCASACLDFADLVLSVPGAVHAGEETSADAVYIDTTFVTLPSGNGFVLPLKVWRNRLRGNNETLIPDRPLVLDTMDEDVIRARVIAAVGASMKEDAAGTE